MRRRPASIYVMVLATALLVSVLGLSALLNVQVRSQAPSSGADFTQARLLAQSAIDYGMWLTVSDPGWRSNRPNGAWLTGLSAAGGTMDLSVVDPNDGDLADMPTEAVRMTGTGRFGEAAYSLSVRLKPQAIPLEALRTCLHVDADLRVPNTARITASGGPVSSNGTITVDGRIIGDVEAQAVNKPANVLGNITAPAPPKAAPDADVLEFYWQRATPLPYTVALFSLVLSHQRNPWGTPNPDGLYRVDTGGNNLDIGGMRLLGTLVIRTQGGRVRLNPSVLMQPYRADYPVLIVDGDLEFRIDPSTALSEALWNANFNPPGAPYNSNTDQDKLDTYPNTVAGLVEVRGQLRFNGNASLSGALIAQTCADPGQTITLTHIDTLWTDPPIGYATYVLKPVPGSWRRMPLPDVQ